MACMKILLTAFEPFDGRKENQSSKLANQIHLEHVDVLVLPVLYQFAFTKLRDYLSHKHYDMIMMLGEGPNKVMHLEHVALNMMDARIPDANGFQPINQPIDDGPLAIKTTLPLDRFLEILDSSHIAHTHSYHAGTYVCNDLFYRMMRLDLQIPCGFIHVPSDSKFEIESLIGLKCILSQL